MLIDREIFCDQCSVKSLPFHEDKRILKEDKRQSVEQVNSEPAISIQDLSIHVFFSVFTLFLKCKIIALKNKGIKIIACKTTI
jgi:hypothetical protein